MDTEYYMPRSLSPKRLDKYLASGWFRSGEMLYRSKIISWHGEVASVINIRLNLRYHTLSKRLRKVLRKNRELFRTEIVVPSDDFFETGEEALYQQHKNRFHGFVFSSLSEFFYNTSSIWSIFDTLQIKVFDGDKLVATSFFDKGANSIASIMGLFDPEYSKYSLGIYTMLEEMEYMRETQRQFYYPGYLLDIPSMLDYKLSFGNVEFYDWEGRWLPQSKLDRENTPARQLNALHHAIERRLNQLSVPFRKWMNPLFTITSIMEESSGYEGMLRGAMLFFLQEGDKYSSLLEYLPDEQVYQWSLVRKEAPPFFLTENLWQLNRNNPKVKYLTDLFVYERVIHREETLGALLQKLIESGKVRPM